ncbi:HNH endonuclease [Natronolimnohabitans innermongolicus]|uniref:HNH endonuclease n=1 Tax=Natronolimnohabitans innermongolicus JCM 12255 TaxID=1227499 RepID=L9WK35_9EURY|nr:HNH endonuclease [Natronolimnohabitans innermongolicus]ELY49541.1 HNH endonuclease [Natronolimnohabitans innermongolicus JCM 12255]
MGTNGRTDHTERPDDRGYGPGWDELRAKTLRRDGYACRRCGADDRTLQAHHVVPRSAGGPDELENLVTVCRPCHGVIHQSNRAFDDVRDDAPLFPDRTAPAPVARMRTPDDQCCSRCGGERADPTELVAWTDPTDAASGSETDHETLCKPCAGLVLEAEPACTRDGLTGNHEFSTHELTRRRTDASVRPSLFASPAVAIRREPRGARERLVDDTPLRFLVNHRGVRWATLAVVCYVLLMVVLVP